MLSTPLLAAWLLDESFARVRAWHHHPGWRSNGDPGDKHGPPVDLEGMDGYLICVKSPWAWVVSMSRYRPAPVGALVRTWNTRHGEYLAFCASSSRPVVVMRYEDLLADLAGCVGRLSAAFGLSGRSAAPRLPARAMGRGGDRMRHAMAERPFDRSYYDEARYLAALGAEARGVLRRELDAELLAAFGYEARASCDAM